MGTGASKQGTTGTAEQQRSLLERALFDDGSKGQAAQAGAAAAAELSAEDTKKLWFGLIKADRMESNTVSQSLKNFITSHNEAFQSDDAEKNPLLWQDEQGNNVLHLILEFGIFVNKALLELLLTANSQHKGKTDPLLQENNAGKTAFELAIAENDLLILQSDGAKFLSQACLKLNPKNGESILHIAARSLKPDNDRDSRAFITLQELSSKQAASVTETAERGKAVDLGNPLNARNEAGESVLEVAIKSGNFQAVSSLTSGALASPSKRDTLFNKVRFGFEKAVGEVTTHYGIATNLNEKNSKGERPIDLFNPENFPLLTIKNLALSSLAKDSTTPIDDRKEFNHNRFLAVNSACFLINALGGNVKFLGRDEDDKSEKNPIYQFLKLGLFTPALEYVQKCDISVLKGELGDNIKRAIAGARTEFTREYNDAKNLETPARETSRSEAFERNLQILDDAVETINQRLKRDKGSAAAAAGAAAGVGETTTLLYEYKEASSAAGTSPTNPTARQQQSSVCVLQ